MKLIDRSLQSTRRHRREETLHGHLETTTPRHFKRDWMVERLSPLVRMFMIGSSYGNSTGRFHCGLDLIDFGTLSSWRPLPPLRNRCFDNVYTSFRKRVNTPRLETYLSLHF